MNYDQFMAALCIWREARSCTKQEMEGIWWVLLNRARDHKNRWPKSIHKVVLQHSQFSAFNTGDPNSNLFPMIDTPEWSKFQVAMDVTAIALSADPVLGANHYENAAQGHLPGWADQNRLTAQIGPFRFYRL